MKPRLHLLDSPTIGRVVAEAFELLVNPGVRIGSSGAANLLASHGARVDSGIAQIPKSLVLDALHTVPRSFHLYTRDGRAAVTYGDDAVHFDPGSSCVQVLDGNTVRPAVTADLVRTAKVTETLPQFAAQSTAVVCSDVPQETADIHRLHIILQNSSKPIVTGSFSAAGLHGMIDLLIADAGSAEHLRARPRAIFDVCPSPPLNWSDFGSQNLIQLARAGVPAEIVSMPIAGGAAPVTLIGSITQHAAECLAGITIHQLARPGSPIVWGGAPAILDMRTGSAPMGAIETAMLNLGCTEVGKHFGLPTHGYLVASDSKLVDEQCGSESARSAVLGALAGINMISGAGMLDSLATFSLEKLVLDAEAIASAMRLTRGVESSYPSFATDAFAQAGLSGEFLILRETRTLFRQEQHIPGAVVDRSARSEGHQKNSFERAAEQVEHLLAQYAPPVVDKQVLAQFDTIMRRERDNRCAAATA